MKAIEVLKEFISKNIGWKIFSLFFAAVLWFVVMNLNNPTETQTYTVNLSILNEDKLTENSYTILNREELEQTKVSIRIKASRSALDELNKRENKGSISASIDLKQFDILYTPDGNDPVSINITPQLPSTIMADMYEIESFYPTSVKLNIDNIITVEREVSIIQSGDVSTGYTAYAPVSEPETVSITGPSTKINTINRVCAYLNVDNATQTISEVSKVYISDDSGQSLEELEAEPNFVTLSMKINKQGTLKVGIPKHTGVPADGYEFKEIICEPSYVDILGTSDKTTELTLPDINISGLSEDKTFEFDAKDYLNDENLSLRNTHTKINVTVKIVQQKLVDIEVPAEQISISGYDSANYEISNDSSVSITVAGIPDNVDNIDVSQITGSVDLSGLSVGNHRVLVKLDMPSGVTLYDDAVMTVKISEKKKTETTAAQTTVQQTEAQTEAQTETTTEAAEENNEEETTQEVTTDE